MSKVKQIESFLEKHFNQSMYAGEVAANNKVKHVGFGKFRVFTSSQGTHQNDVVGTFDEVMNKLQLRVDMFA